MFHSLFDFIQDKKYERLEFKFDKDVLKSLVSKLATSRQLSLESTGTEPDLGLFVIKQTFVPEITTKIEIF